MLDAGGIGNIKLRQIPRIYRQGDGDCGICFEYAVHEAIASKNQKNVDKIDDVLANHCKIKSGDISSLLFGAEKTGSLQIIQSVKENLTNESRLLVGTKGQPVRLKKHIDAVASSFRRAKERDNLPESIKGLWKADLFIGRPTPDQWIGTTVKINPSHLEAAKGLRLGIVPSRQGTNDLIYKDDKRNLIVCPIPYDGSFMEVFYYAWIIVQQFIAADAKMPKEVKLPRPSDRQVCQILSDRREFPVLDVLDALLPLAQPELLDTETKEVEYDLKRGKEKDINLESFFAPISLADGK